MKYFLIILIIIFLGAFSIFYWRGNEEESLSENFQDQEILDYKNGNYQASSSYRVPNGNSHNIDVDLEIKEDKIIEMKLSFDGQEGAGASTLSNQRFSSEIDFYVLDKDIDELSLSRIGGASLTTNSFNEALKVIKNTASN